MKTSFDHLGQKTNKHVFENCVTAGIHSLTRGLPDTLTAHLCVCFFGHYKSSKQFENFFKCRPINYVKEILIYGLEESIKRKVHIIRLFMFCSFKNYIYRTKVATQSGRATLKPEGYFERIFSATFTVCLLTLNSRFSVTSLII